MIDIHAHILPDLDDGSEDMEESLKDYKLGRNDKVNLINASMHTNNLDSKTIKGIYTYLKELNSK